jgi:cytochrome c-type biogenesis protein CcmH/NrfF
MVLLASVHALEFERSRSDSDLLMSAYGSVFVVNNDPHQQTSNFQLWAQPVLPLVSQ